MVGLHKQWETPKISLSFSTSGCRNTPRVQQRTISLVRLSESEPNHFSGFIGRTEAAEQALVKSSLWTVLLAFFAGPYCTAPSSQLSRSLETQDQFNEATFLRGRKYALNTLISLSSDCLIKPQTFTGELFATVRKLANQSDRWQQAKPYLMHLIPKHNLFI